MVNFIERVLQYPDYSRQFTCGDSLITAFNCPLEARLMKNRFTDLWSQNNYIFYVIDGRKIWHTATGSFDLEKGSCAFVQKGASIIEQFFDIGFCLVLFFIPDQFICETLKTRVKPIQAKPRNYETLIRLNTNETLKTFFLSMSSYFAGTKEPDQGLLELKFRELILTLADDPMNDELLSCFNGMLSDPQSVSLQRVMENNYCFNLSLNEYAELSNRSLSALKRDFKNLMNATPGKWLLHRRLTHAMNLLSTTMKTVSEVAFESGFENASHFSRCFKNHYNATPKAFREKIRS